ncbi:MAG: NAD-dependent protein deacetylase, partial [Peptococcaceae bacterium]|nr:NAD-dependent protein deacetylase [Peptococcaceae bacterium]
MSFYEDLVMQTQRNYHRHYGLYAAGETPYELSDKNLLSYSEQLTRLVQEIADADCVVVGGASGLSAAGGGDFYYEDNASFRKYFGKFAERYHFKGAFNGMMHRWEDRTAFWAYLATFLHTTQTAPVRQPYLDLDDLLSGKDFFVLTTNQDTQFVKLYPDHKVAEIQGDHRFFQCSVCCTDDTWDAVQPVEEMIAAMGDGITVPASMIPRCPHCGAEAFPWVRGYGNFLQGEKYEEQYDKISRYVLDHKEGRMLFLELGVGRMTPMFIQEPFWHLTHNYPDARYIG